MAMVYLSILSIHSHSLTEKVHGYNVHMDGLQFGAIVSTYAFGQFIGNIALGIASDRFGRRSTLMVTTLMVTLFGCWTAFAPSIWQLALSRGGAGLMAGTGGILQSYVADCTTPQDRPLEIGRLGAASAFGLLLGPSVGVVFGYTLGVQDGFFIAALLAAGISFLNFVAVFLFLPESPRFAESSLSSAARKTRPVFPFKLLNGTVAALYLSSGLCSFVFVLLESVLPLLLIRGFGYPPYQMIVIYATYIVISVLIQGFLFGRVMGYVEDKRDLVTGACLVGAALILGVPLYPIWEVSLGLLVLLGMALIMVGPCISVLVTFLAKGRNGALLGGRSSIVSIARALSPLINGPLYDVSTPYISHALPFVVSCASLVCASICIRFARDSLLRQEDSQRTKRATETLPLLSDMEAPPRPRE